MNIIFQVVLNDYTDPEKNERAIDCFFNKKETDGCTVAWVNLKTGNYRLGDNSKPEYLLCNNVQQAILEVQTGRLNELLTQAKAAIKRNI